MEYTSLKGYRISKLTLGTVALGMDYGISNSKGQPTEKEARDVIVCALNSGINSIDTARTYGKAEEVIGDFFEREYKQTLPTIITKFKISSENLINKDKVRREVYESVKTSIRNLRLKKLPICLFHSNRQLTVEKVLEILPNLMEDLKNDNLIDVAGVSLDHPSEAPFFLNYEIFNAFQVPINLFDTRIIQSGCLEKMHTMGKIVFARSVFLQGLFFMIPEQLQGDLADAAVYLRILRKIANSAKISIAQLAFSFVNHLEGVSSIVFGAVTPAQVQQNVGMVNFKPLKDEVKQLIKNYFDKVPEHIITPGLWPSIKTK